MNTFIVVKSKGDSKRYHIYNAAGNCLAVVTSREAVFRYFDAELTTSPCMSYTYRCTCNPAVAIVILH